MITVDHLSKQFGKIRAVDDASFEIAQGRAVALWGTNGAGKTTIIRCVLGVIHFQGSIRIDGHDIRRAGKKARGLIGYVPQELAFHEELRVGAAMRFCASLRRVSTARAVELLERVGLEGNERKRVRELSGGMKQRLALAMALISDPPIIILDEPTSNLDSAARADGIKLLKGLRESGKTLLFASHRPEEITELADEVIVLEKGRVIGRDNAGSFAERIARRHFLRLDVGADRMGDAFEALQAAGLDVSNNGHGLCVRTPASGKAEPIHVLSRASIEVRDFELLTFDESEEMP